MFSLTAVRSASLLMRSSQTHAPMMIRCLGSAAASTSVPDIDYSKLRIVRAPTLKKKPALDATLKFGAQFTDHMLAAEWSKEAGWEAPRIQPYGPLLLDPSVSSLHYALQGFEGMKAYKDAKGRVRLFRPSLNMRRFNATAKKLSLPAFDGDQLLACIKELVRLDRDWVPDRHGFSLYLRPTMISTHAALGVTAPNKAMVFVIMSPVGPYFESGFKAVNLLADPNHVRAWPGGTGGIKCGGNYGATIEPQLEAKNQGFTQILWLFGDKQYVTEVGTMNQFFFWVNEEGERELVTAPLDGTILPGVTRDSILALTRQWGEFKVSERLFTIFDVARAVEEGRMLEAFGAGTAALVCPVKSVHYMGKTYDIPLDPSKPSVEAGPLTQRLMDTITNIQYGVVEHEWSVVLD